MEKRHSCHICRELCHVTYWPWYHAEQLFTEGEAGDELVMLPSSDTEVLKF